MSPIMTENSRDKSVAEEKLRKERLLDEKMKLIRQKNEERMIRRKEIEEDIRNANSHSEDVVGKSTIQSGHKMSGVKTEGKPVSKFRGRARGRVLEKMAQEKPQAHRFKERQRQNYELEEKEVQEQKTSSGLGKSSGFLTDDRRVDMSKSTSRSIHSWGGSQFESAVDKINKEQPRRKQDQNIDINMTGKERLRYHDWKEERSKIDTERKSRQMKGNTWNREWDQYKVQKGSDSSFGERQDQHDGMRSGQRFGESARQRPDWDHHDNRDGDSFTDTTRTQSGKGEMRTNESSENWDENENMESRQEIVCSDSIETRNTDQEDWEIETEETPINIYDNVKKFDQDQNVTVHETCKEVQEPEDLYKEEETTPDSPQEENIPQSDKVDTERVENFIVTVDQQGRQDVTETIGSPTDAVLNETTLNTKTGENDGKTPVDETCNSSEFENKSEENEVAGDTCQLLHVTTRDDSNVRSSCGGNEEEPGKTVTEINTNKASITQEHSTEADESQAIQESANTTVTKAPEKDIKPKRNLPKLDLTTSKTEQETVPDFLKTPQQKDWADCEFDEDSLDFSPELVFYP